MELLKKIFIKKPKVYNSCKEMPLYNFKMYLDTQDLIWFSKDGKRHKNLNTVMVNFFDEYIKLTNNRKVLNRFVKMQKMMKLDIKYMNVTLLLNAIENHKLSKKELDQNIKNLREWGYKLYKEKDLFMQTNKIRNRIQNLKTQYQLLQAEISDDDKEESISLEKQLIIVSKGLELGYKIDLKDTTVYEWYEYQQLLKEKQA